ncbi:MAG TPA: thiosulfate oxidation carrier complex protein SoxZ [Thiothrix sp.]|nr:thiosulfate oxidation carrier complex protein SoxZ [Thiothrix sp.]
MAKATAKVRAKAKDGLVDVKALFSHPMETGLRKDKKTGEVIPADYINKITLSKDGKEILVANWSGAISKNPMFFAKYKGASGDKITLSWTDNTGGTGSIDADVK